MGYEGAVYRFNVCDGQKSPHQKPNTRNKLLGVRKEPSVDTVCSGRLAWHLQRRGAACIENKCGFGFFAFFLRLFFFFNWVFLQDPFELAQLHENVTFVTVTPH